MRSAPWRSSWPNTSSLLFTYEQSTGLLLFNGRVLGHGYAGHGAGVDRPDMQDRQGIGPLPRGKYRIGPPHESAKTGRLTMNLDPDPANEMFGRSAFRIHGDNQHQDRSASEGCIVMPLGVRLAIARSIGYRVDPQDYSWTAIPAVSDNTLTVVA